MYLICIKIIKNLQKKGVMIYCDEMQQIQLYLNTDSIKECLEEIGKAKIIQFIDSNTKKTKKINSDLERLKSRCIFLDNEIKKLGIQSNKMKKIILENYEAEVEKSYQRMNELLNIEKETTKNLEIIRENYLILEETENYLGSEIDTPQRKELRINLDYVSGIIEREKSFLLIKVLEQAMRGNLIVHVVEKLNKRIFIIFTHGENSLRKIQHICISMGARTIDPFDKRIHKKEMGLLNISALITQLEKVRDDNREVLKTFSRKIAQRINYWKYCIRKEERIHNITNMMCTEDTPTIQAWIRKKDISAFKKLIDHLSDNHSGIAYELISDTSTKPPTSITTNKYTSSFQDVTNTFGIPAPDEINPGVFNLFLVPFLFGSMFGDVGHGLILLFLSIFIIQKGHKIKSELFEMIYMGRYMMLVCSFATIYFGILYSDFFSLPFNLFNFTTPPLIGVDTKWHHADNGIEFMNSLKMKLSIVIGVVHMSFGLILAFWNSIRKNDKLTIFTVLLPKLISYLSFGGYLLFLIIFKWLTGKDMSIVSVLTNMFVDPFGAISYYPYQKIVQLFLLCLFVISAPWLVFCKTLYRIINRQKIGEDLIHCAIDCIEYYIGLISNLASYLRIWAVSLAHFQLTSILNMFFLADYNFLLKIIVGFPAWILGTLIIMIGLEGLSSTLHAMRLNWVEFYSKFYSPDGYLYEPFNFEK